MNRMIEANRAHWDELAKIHQRPSAYYSVEAFKSGELSLRPLELGEVGDVRGKSLLHLQCHFGLDTLSWARLGAAVIGVDFSTEALQRSRELALECRLDARFICADLNELDVLDQRFDIVFTSFGTTVWLPDLERWASLIARSLAPDGFFYVADGHPFSRCIDNAVDPAVLRIVEPYFKDGPTKYDGGTDYAVRDASVSTTGYEWSHTLGDIVTALASAGLRIVFLHEHPYGDWEVLQGMQRGGDGYYRLADTSLRVPHMYSLEATR